MSSEITIVKSTLIFTGEHMSLSMRDGVLMPSPHIKRAGKKYCEYHSKLVDIVRNDLVGTFFAVAMNTVTANGEGTVGEFLVWAAANYPELEMFLYHRGYEGLIVDFLGASESSDWMTLEDLGGEGRDKKFRMLVETT
ncbi:hypothetical protein OAU50_02235 [Planctomycetota bacterium]|nr:hypothetical protein [Planctomycetota bacterium]